SKDLPRTNPGRISSGFLRRYQHAELGGWWVSGLDPYNNWERMVWGRFKPTHPRIDSKGRFIKYESPPKIPNRVTYFDVPDCIWDKVAKRYGIKRYNSPLALRLRDRSRPLNFWEWVLAHPEIPIILCEGEKKAAALLSLGFVAIALPGIWNGRVGKKDFDERLHPDLMPLAQPGRKIQILFDHETKRKTRWAVFQATIRTGKALEAVKCQSEVILLPGPEKGVDDFASARRMDADFLLTAIIDDAKSLDDYRRSFFISNRGLSKKYPADIRVNVKYLSEVITLPNSGLVVLWSDVGTGKTELLKKWLEEHPEVRFLNNGHRVNLLKNLAERLKTEMYSDLSYGDLAKAKALSITIDSLYKLNTEMLEYGCVFIDEACQYLTHLLHSKTCKKHRAQILEVLEYIVRNAPLVVIADAHMDDVTVDFFRAIREGEKPKIIVNEWRNGDRPIFWYEGSNESAVVAQVAAALMRGEKVMVASDSKKFVKKLEKLLTMPLQFTEESTESSSSKTSPKAKKAGSTATKSSTKTQRSKAQTPTNSKTSDSDKSPIKIWSIHSDNSGSEENVAFIKDISNSVMDVDGLLVSPSLGTGVDIPNYHFDAVYGVFHGASQTATECVQQLYRYRPKVPIHVWVAPRPPFGYKETSAAIIKKRMLQTNEITAFVLQIDRETGKRGVEKDWALDAHCKIQAQRHQSINNLRADLRNLLSEMGNQIIPMGTDENYRTREGLKNAGDAIEAAYRADVAKAKDISKSEYRARQTKDYLKPDEAVEYEKFRIKDAYGMEVTEELVEKDKSGKLIRAITSLEAVIASPEGTITDPETGKIYPLPPEVVAEKDRSERMNLPLCMDWGNYSAQWLARSTLGLPNILQRLINGEEVTSRDPELVKMTNFAMQCAPHVKAILGFKVPEKCTPIWLLATLIDQLGLKLDNHKVGPKGKQVKHYLLRAEEWEFAQHVIKYRENKRSVLEERARQTAEEERRYQAGIEAQYGVSPPPDPVSTPPPNGIRNSPSGGVDTTAQNQENFEKIDNSSPIYEVSGDLEPNDGDSTPIQTSLQMLRKAIVGGVEAVLATICSWTSERRWCAVLLLEEVAEGELRNLEQMIPSFYAWLSEFSS
ncbi:MAG: DUF3854 domain-containing protein, partial [Cyanobacteria bacterium P01_C01_bin.38]